MSRAARCRSMFVYESGRRGHSISHRDLMVIALFNNRSSRPGYGKFFAKLGCQMSRESSGIRWKKSAASFLGGIGARLHRSEKSLSSARTVTEDNSIRLECDLRDDERNEIPLRLHDRVPAKFKRFESKCFLQVANRGDRVDYGTLRWERLNFILAIRRRQSAIALRIAIKLIHCLYPQIDPQE